MKFDNVFRGPTYTYHLIEFEPRKVQSLLSLACTISELILNDGNDITGKPIDMKSEAKAWMDEAVESGILTIGDCDE